MIKHIFTISCRNTWHVHTLLLHNSLQTKWRWADKFVFNVKRHSDYLGEQRSQRNILKDNEYKRWWQSLQSLNSYKTASMQHQRAMFWAFSDQQSIGLSVESIDSSHQHFLSRQQPRFLQATLQLHQSRSFQQQALSGIESISGCTFNSVSGRFEEKSPVQRKCRRVKESESDEECHCLDWSWNFNIGVVETFPNLAVHFTTFCTWMNLPNVARYGRDPDFVISVSVINVAIQ